MSCVSFGHGKRILIPLYSDLSDGPTTVKGKALLLAAPYKLFFDQYAVYMFSQKDDLPPDYSIREMANDQASAMNTLGIDKTCIMGVSQGGIIAQYLTIDHPQLEEKLVLAVTASYSNDTIRKCVLNWIALAERSRHIAPETSAAPFDGALQGGIPTAADDALGISDGPMRENR